MSSLLSVSLPDELAAQIDALVAATGRTRSELVRDALRRQVRVEQFAALRELGQDRAEIAGVGPEDVEDLVDQVRGSSN